MIPYLGGKTKYLRHISQALDELDPNQDRSVLDLFAGSGVVAFEAANKRPTVANDIQEYTRVLVNGQVQGFCGRESEFRAAILAEYARLAALPEIDEVLSCERRTYSSGDPEKISQILSRGSLSAYPEEVPGRAKLLDSALGVERLVCFSYYGGVFFSYQQALWIDVICRIARSERWGDPSAGLLVAILMAATHVSSVGSHFAQPIAAIDRQGTIKRDLIKRVANKRLAAVENSIERAIDQVAKSAPPRENLIATRLDFSKALEEHALGAVVYADPPYTREHYSRFYHVLETIALGDDPGLSRSNLRGGSEPSRGLYRAERHQSPFSILGAAENAFDQLYSAASNRGAPVLLSYSPAAHGTLIRPRTVSLERILEIAHSYYPTVETSVVENAKHARLNKRELSQTAPLGAEVLIASSL